MVISIPIERQHEVADLVYERLARLGPATIRDIALELNVASRVVKETAKQSSLFERTEFGHRPHIWSLSNADLAAMAVDEVIGMQSVPSWPVGYLANAIGATPRTVEAALRADPRWEEAEPSPWNGDPVGPWFRFAV
jgi:hypothetical protein